MKFEVKKPTKTFYIRLVAILVVILVAILMYVIGKQHNIYIDNKDYGSLMAFSYVEVSVDKQEPLGLAKRDRDVFTVVNQSHKFKVEANGEEKEIKLKLPLNMKNVIINLPAFMAGLDQSEWMQEFIIETQSVQTGGDEIITDDTAALFE